MKKQLFTFFLIAGMAMGVQAQQPVQVKDLPAAIQTSFKNEFADASGAEWKMKDGSYTAAGKLIKSKKLRKMVKPAIWLN